MQSLNNCTREQHEAFMRLAIAEAEQGLGRTSPNPAVGAVIVNGGQVVGRGYHHKAGTPHAEVHAIADAGEAARGGTIYVTLEPCNHTGRTPPCTQAILKAGLKGVVIGAMDPNPQVVGGGAAFLAGQGLAVLTGVLEEPCTDLIRPFVKHSSSGLPWVMMKAGLSLDGRISLRKGEATVITGEQSRQFTHQLRDRVDAILIGVETALVDDPSLTTRLVGKAGCRDPLRIVLDSQLRLPPTARMLRQESTAQTWVCCGIEAPIDREQALVAAGAVVHRLPLANNGGIDVQQLLVMLGKHQIVSLLVEGGAAIHGAFWSQQLVDELLLFYAPLLIGDQGIPLLTGYALHERQQAPRLSGLTLRHLGEDMLLRALVAK